MGGQPLGDLSSNAGASTRYEYGLLIFAAGFAR